MLSLSEIASRLNATLRGDAAISVTRVADLQTAQIGDIAFLADEEYLPSLATCRASAIIVRAEHAALVPGSAIIVELPYLAYARVAQWLDPTPVPAAGIHPSAIIDPSTQMGVDVSIGPLVVIGANVVLGDRVSIGAGSVLGEQVQLGADTRLWPRVCLYHDVKMGERCIVHSGTVIGSDGFGYAPHQRTWVRIPQTGGVIIGDDVDIGANCAIDRGALGNTCIGNGVKLDNLIHIAHNVEIGDHCAAAATTAIAGSAKLGRYVTLAGRANILGHLDVCDGAHVTACTLVTKSIREPGAYSSGTTAQPNREWRKSVARFFQLDELFRRVRALEKRDHITADESKK